MDLRVVPGIPDGCRTAGRRTPGEEMSLHGIRVHRRPAVLITAMVIASGCGGGDGGDAGQKQDVPGLPDINYDEQIQDSVDAMESEMPVTDGCCDGTGDTDGTDLAWTCKDDQDCITRLQLGPC